MEYKKPTSDLRLEDLPEEQYLKYWFMKFRRALQDVRNCSRGDKPEKYVARDVLNEFTGWLERHKQDKAQEVPPNGGTDTV